MENTKDIFNKTYDCYSKNIYYICATMLKNHHAAEDICHDTFLIYYSFLNTNRITNLASPYSFLKKTAINKCKDYFKKNNRIDIVDPIKLCEMSDTNFKINEESNLIDFEMYISKLPDTYREVILLYYYSECTYKEIATVLNININLVKYRLREAKISLKRRIVQDEK